MLGGYEPKENCLEMHLCVSAWQTRYFAMRRRSCQLSKHHETSTKARLSHWEIKKPLYLLKGMVRSPFMPLRNESSARRSDRMLALFLSCLSQLTSTRRRSSFRVCSFRYVSCSRRVMPLSLLLLPVVWAVRYSLHRKLEPYMCFRHALVLTASS